VQAIPTTTTINQEVTEVKGSPRIISVGPPPPASNPRARNESARDEAINLFPGH